MFHPALKIFAASALAVLATGCAVPGDPYYESNYPSSNYPQSGYPAAPSYPYPSGGSTSITVYEQQPAYGYSRPAYPVYVPVPAPVYGVDRRDDWRERQMREDRERAWRDRRDREARESRESREADRRRDRDGQRADADRRRAEMDRQRAELDRQRREQADRDNRQRGEDRRPPGAQGQRPAPGWRLEQNPQNRP